VLSPSDAFGVLRVPGDGRIRITPGHLVRLIYDHESRPPDEFVPAVERGPAPGSLADFDASACSVRGEGSAGWRSASHEAVARPWSRLLAGSLRVFAPTARRRCVLRRPGSAGAAG